MGLGELIQLVWGENDANAAMFMQKLLSHPAMQTAYGVDKIHMPKY